MLAFKILYIQIKDNFKLSGDLKYKKYPLQEFLNNLLLNYYKGGKLLEWYESIELLCVIITTISTVFSSIILFHYFLKKIDIYVTYENDKLTIYANALSYEIILKRIEIDMGNKCMNTNDNFFANGKETISINVKKLTVIKQLKLRVPLGKFMRIKITFINNTTESFFCLVRRIK